MKNIIVVFFFLIVWRIAYSQCTLNVNLTASNPAICSGNVVVLSATASAGTPAYSYVWNTGETTQTITVNKSGTYTVSVSDHTAGCQPVSRSITITSAAIPDPPVSTDVIVCPNSRASLTASSSNADAYQWYDAPSGGNFLATGSTYLTQPITSPTTFYVERIVAGCSSPRTAVNVAIINKPVITGATVCENLSAHLSASGSDSYKWYSSAAATPGTELSVTSSFDTPPLSATTTYYVVGTNGSCVSEPTAVTATVTPAPQAPVVTGPASVCSGTSASFHAASNGAGVFDWFDVPTGGTSLISSPDYTTAPLTANATYYVQQTSPGGCVSARTAVTITINPIPTAPVVANVAVCSGAQAFLTATAPGGTYNWYASANSKTVIAIGSTFVTPALTNSTSYYVEAVNSGGCVGPRTQVNVTVNPIPAAPTVTGTTVVCSGSTTTLHASAAEAGTFEWFDAANTSIYQGSDLVTPPLAATTTYYVQFTSSATGCTSSRSQVTVTVNSIPAAPTVAAASTCSGSSATLTATAPGGTYNWYNSATDVTVRGTGSTFNTGPLTTNTTFYVDATINSCTGPRTAVTVTVNAVPAAPTVSGTSTVCSGSQATLTASAPGGTIEWYRSSAGGSPVASGSTYTPTVTSTTTYYAQNTVGTCSSSRTAITVSVYPTISSEFFYSSGTFCTAGANPSPTINNPYGGIFTAPAGLVFVDNTTGEINVGASTPGKYPILFTGNDPCHTVNGVDISIVTTPSAQFTYPNASYCQDGPNALPKFGTTPQATAGTFTSSPGLVFKNKYTGEVDVSASTPGPYTVNNYIGTNAGCPDVSANAAITIDPKVTVNAGPDQLVARGTVVTLAGSYTVAPGITWSVVTGGGTFSDVHSVSSTYTPAAGETTATLALTTDPSGACDPKTDKMTITFNPVPPAPTVANTAVCYGDVATLTATAPGGTYRWYDTPSGGTVLYTGDTFTTPALTTSTSYYVETTYGGLTGSRAQVDVTVNPIPPAPSAPATVTTCTGSQAVLTASGSTGSYEWFDAPSGGTQVGAGSSFTTPPVTAPISYYVQTTVNNCVSSRTQVNITTTPLPIVTSAPTDEVCSGTALNYTITANMPATTYTWTRAAVAGISNAAITTASPASGSTINEALINTTGTSIDVTYVITPYANGCSGPAFNYVVTVYATPALTSAAAIPICSGNPVNYTLTFNTSQTEFTWSRAAVAGISNSPVSGQATPTIQEVLYNTTNTPVDVVYVINSKSGTCTGTPVNLTVTVNPLVKITSPIKQIVCSGEPQNYTITANIPAATFSWYRDAVPGLSNNAVSGQTSNTITEALINTKPYPLDVIYWITPYANGCAGTPFRFEVVVNPQPQAPGATSNSPVCVNSTIKLFTPTIQGASYYWTGPSGFSSTAQNPTVTNVSVANGGAYNLIITVNNCTSPPTTIQVVINQPAVVDPGQPQSVCVLAGSVQLNGTVTPTNGGPSTTTGIWTTNGTGSFLPAANVLNPQYIPSVQDKANGSVMLTLTSTSPDDCVPDQKSINITFVPEPVVSAGPGQDLCSQTTNVALSGQSSTGAGIWSTSGSGSFNDATLLNAVYTPGAADIAAGSVILMFTATGPPGACTYPSDTMTVKFIPPPTVYAGGTRYVLQGRTVVLNPTVSDNNVTYLWTPNVFIDNNKIRNPTVTGDVDRTYRLTVTDVRGCESFSDVLVKVSPPIIVTNTFTPNGDGINDVWDIQGIVAYEGATVDIFDRYGHKLFHSVNYAKPWDGTYNGQALPVGTYYYIIDAKAFNQVFSGYVTILK